MQIASLNIEEVANQLKLWRESNGSKFRSIPEHLKHKIRILLNQYPTLVIAKHLKISSSTAHSIKKMVSLPINTLCPKPLPVNDQDSEQKINFIPFQLANNESKIDIPNQQDYSTCCQIVKPNGIKLIIQSSDPASIIKAFLCSN